jgi:hypothetical protein
MLSAAGFVGGACGGASGPNTAQWNFSGSFPGKNPLFYSSSTLHFSDYSFMVHHPVNRDDRHLLAHAMASDFSVAWQ